MASNNPSASLRRGIIHHADYELEYFLFGDGPETLIAFHGFNNNAHDFGPLIYHSKKFTVVSVNIFFHGGSTVTDRMIEKGFSNSDLRSLFSDIYNIRQIDKYTLLGYSLGGRIVLKIMEMFPEQVKTVVLLAPDGLKLNPFYLFFARTSLGRKMLKQAVYHPDFFYSLAAFLKKTHLIGEKKYQFALNNFENKSKREKVYQIWLSLRNVISKKQNLRTTIRKYQIPVHMFFGRYDKIIPVSMGKKFRNGLEAYVKLWVLDEGHRLIRPDVLETVIKAIEKE